MSSSTSPVELHVKGMSCQHCVKGVTRAIQSKDPDAVVDIDLGEGKVKVTSQLSREAISAAIEEEGYKVLA